MNKNTFIIFLIFIFILLTNFGIVFKTPFELIHIISGLIFALFLPGTMIVLNITDLKDKLTEKLIFAIGLSISVTIFSALLLNQTLWILNIDKPLSWQYFVIFIDIILGFLLINFTFSKKKYILSEFSLSVKDITISLFTLIFPLLAFFGAEILNNNGNNTLTIFLLLLIPLYISFLSLFSKKISPFIFIVSIYMIGLSTILMYSSRSNNLIGWDIQSELKVFNITLDKLFWSKDNINHAYNTTLAITILPTIINQLTGLDTNTILKLIYPIIFALITPAIFLIICNFFTPILAFLGTFFFIAQLQFFQQMPGLARQQIALLMFVLAILTFFKTDINRRSKIFLFLIFNFTLIVSHYSTAYISSFLFAGVYLLSVMVSVINKFKKILMLPKTILSFPIVLLLLVSVFFWYGFYTGSISYLHGFAIQVRANLTKVFSEEGKSAQAKLAVSGESSTYTSKEIEIYKNEIRNEYNNDKVWVNNYSSEVYSKYLTYPKYADFLPKKHIFFQNPLKIIIQLDQKIIKFSIIFSLIIWTILLFLKKSVQIPIYYIFFGWISLILMIIIILVPYISIAYNIERMYQQSLIFLSIFGISGLTLSFSKRIRFLPFQFTILTTSGLLIIYFLFYSGLISVFFGGNATLNLNNFGEDYERFYIFDGEKYSAKWLNQNKEKNQLIYSDTYGLLRLQAYTNFTSGFLTDIYPGVIDKKAYVYATNTNLYKNNARVNFKNTFMIFNFPIEFLEDNKNLIYSDNTSKIYK